MSILSGVQNQIPCRQHSITKKQPLNTKQLNIPFSAKMKQQINESFKDLYKITQTQESCSFLMVTLLGDPNLKELSENLQKQAEQHRRKQLLSKFSIRYQQLLNLQAKFFKLHEENSVRVNQIKFLQLSLIENKAKHKKQIQHYQQQLKNRQQSLQKAIQQFQERQLQKEKQFRTLKDNYFILKRQISNFQRNETNMKYQINVANSKNQQLNKDINSLIKTHQLQVETLNKQKQSISDQLKSTDIKWKSLLDRQQQNNKQIVNLLKQKQQRIQFLENKINVLTAQLQNVKYQHQQRVAQMSQENLIVREKYLFSIKQIQQLEASFQELQEQFNIERSQHLEIQQKYTKQRCQWDQGQKFVGSLKSQLVKLQEQHQKSSKNHIDFSNQLTVANSLLNQKVSTLEKDLKHSKLQINRLERQNQKVTNMIQKIYNNNTKQTETSNKYVQSLNQKLKTLQKQLEDSLQNNNKMSRKISYLQKKIEKNGDSFDQISCLNQKLKAELKAQEQINDQFHKKQKQSQQSIINSIQQYRNSAFQRISQKQKHLKLIRMILFQRTKMSKMNQNVVKQTYQECQCQKKQCLLVLDQYKKLKLSVEKLKQEMFQLFSKVQDKSKRQKELFQQVIQQNKKLKGFI